MFFIASKIFWFLAEPSNLLVFVFIVAAAGLFTRWRRAARALAAAGAAAFALCALGPVGPLLTRPLEDRFARPPADMPAPDGIIVLGGAMDEVIDGARDVLALDDFGSRMTEGAILARRFPNAALIFTGGSPAIEERDGPTEADFARGLFVALGIDEGRLTLERRSRNTYENAVFTRDIVKPRPGQRFLLVTSAFHIPRAMGVFRRAGYDVVAWPADYMTTGRRADYLGVNRHGSDGMRMTDTAAKEWIGMAAYRASGMTDALFPAP
jgi:uncharacterized SAM-binding protein YcdF (DUF218 family)